MARFPLLHRIRRGEWVDHVITAAQIAVGLVAVMAIAGWLTLNPFLLLSFMFAQPLIAVGIFLFIFAAFFFERATRYESFDEGEIIYQQGSMPRALWLVKSGTVEGMVAQPGGKEQTVETFGPGSYLGFAALAPHMPHKFTARAKTAVEIVRISPGDLISLFKEMRALNSEVPELLKQLDQAIDKFAPEEKASIHRLPDS